MVKIRFSYYHIKQEVFVFKYVFKGVDKEYEICLWLSGIGSPIFFRFIIENYNGGPVETLRGGGRRPRLSKKKIRPKIGEIIKNLIFFLLKIV